MGLVPMVIATACYLWTAAVFAMKKDWWMVLVFVAYAAANYGLMMSATRTLRP